MKESNFDNKLMHYALIEAKKAYDIGEIPVGCVIANSDNSEIISSAHNMVETSQNPLLHAEIIAINEACNLLQSKNLLNYDIYTTLEPCTMCASAISNARLNRVYYATEDSKQGAIENGVRFYSSKSCFHVPEIYSDILKKESSDLLLQFFKKIRL